MLERSQLIETPATYAMARDIGPGIAPPFPRCIWWKTLQSATLVEEQVITLDFVHRVSGEQLVG
jgi:hypothetical protein